MQLKINLQWKFTLYFMALVVGIILFLNFFINFHVINQFNEFCQTYQTELPKCLHSDGGTKFLSTIKISLFWTGGIGLVVALFLGYFMSRFLLTPIQSIIFATKRISRGDYTTRINLKTNDEINELIDSLNVMSQDLGKIEKLRKDLIANISHELATPLTNIYGYAEALTDNVIKDQGERDNAIKIIKSETERLVKLTRELKKLSLLDVDNAKLTFTDEKLDQPIKEVIESFKLKLEDKKIKIETDFIKEAYAKINKDKIKQVVANLLDNAIKYSPKGGRIIIKITIENVWLALSIKDFGEGISNEDKKYIFERFYRADKSRVGNGENIGIGLAIVKKIVDIHKGKIEVKSDKNKGSEFLVYLKQKKRLN